MEFEDGAIYSDSEGCLTVYAQGRFFAFGTEKTFELEDFEPQDRPIFKVVGNDGKILVDRLPYPNRSNLRI